MEGTESTGKSWRSTQVYGLAVICLLSGIGIGYLARAPFQASAVKPQVARSAVARASDAKITPDPIETGGG